MDYIVPDIIKEMPRQTLEVCWYQFKNWSCDLCWIKLNLKLIKATYGDISYNGGSVDHGTELTQKQVTDKPTVSGEGEEGT